MMPPDEMPMDGGDDNEDLMKELLEAANAGDDAEAEGFFADVPGAEKPEGGGDVKLEAEGISPEQLQQLLEALQQGGGGAGGIG